MQHLVCRLLLTGIVIAGSLGAASAYNVTVISAPAGCNGGAYISYHAFNGSINNSGQVVGYGFGCSPNLVLPFVGNGSSSTPIQAPVGWNFGAASWEPAALCGVSINDFGKVAGWAYNNSTGAYAPFTGIPSNTSIVPGPVGLINVDCYNQETVSINNFGQLAANAYDVDAAIIPLVGNASGVTAAPVPPGAMKVFGTSINNSGQVARVWSFGSYQACFIGTLRIPTPADAQCYGEPIGINNSSEVVGSYIS
jgi:hypothetical protein